VRRICLIFAFGLFIQGCTSLTAVGDGGSTDVGNGLYKGVVFNPYTTEPLHASLISSHPEATPKVLQKQPVSDDGQYSFAFTWQRDFSYSVYIHSEDSAYAALSKGLQMGPGDTIEAIDTIAQTRPFTGTITFNSALPVTPQRVYLQGTDLLAAVTADSSGLRFAFDHLLLDTTAELAVSYQLDLLGRSNAFIAPARDAATSNQHISAQSNTIQFSPFTLYTDAQVVLHLLKHIGYGRFMQWQDVTDTTDGRIRTLCLATSVYESAGVAENFASIFFKKSLPSATSFDSLPAAIGYLTALEDLRISGVELKALPLEMSHLHQLANLHLNDNQLEQLPEIFSGFSRLQGLNVARNNLPALPRSLSEASSLTVLWASDNAIEQLDTALFFLPNLRGLDLTRNKLSSISSAIENLKSLYGLDIAYNNLQHLPNSLGALPELYRLDARSNHLENVAQQIFSAPKLRHLLLSDNQISSIEATAAQIEQLEKLSVSRNKLCGADKQLQQALDLLDPDWDQSQSCP